MLDFAAHFVDSFRLLRRIAVGVMHDRSLSEDIVQDAAVIALRKLDEFEPGTSFNAWMGKMVRFVASNACRRERHRRTSPLYPHDCDAEGDRATVPGPESRLDRHGGLSADQDHFDDELMLAMNSVGDTARACLVLRTLDDMGYLEISKLLGIPEGTAMSHVHRTRKTLRDRLSPHVRPGPTEAHARPVELPVASWPREPRSQFLKKTA
jgi:RNA polymerase sigma-70 factor (ECF subfamily)